MSKPRILVEEELKTGSTIKIPEEELHHLRVRRVKPGETFLVINGRGQEAVASLIEENKAHILNVESPTERELPARITLFIGILKGEKMDLLIQKATELGVAEIVPLIMERSIPKPKPSKIKRWAKIAKEATKQCGRVVIPTIRNFSKIEEIDLPELCIVPWEGERNQKISYNHEESVGIIIGPEGGISEEEIQLLKNKGAKPVSLGPVILRSETAALYALSVMRFLILGR